MPSQMADITALSASGTHRFLPKKQSLVQQHIEACDSWTAAES
jgi:hypothetical protein